VSAKAVQIPKDSGQWYVSCHHNGERHARKAASEKEAVRISAEINATIKAEKALRSAEFKILVPTEIAVKILQESLKDAGGKAGACEICFSVYGLERHHLMPKYEAKRVGQKSRDRILICANCHRVAHRKWGQSGSYDGPTARKDFIDEIRKLLMVKSEGSDANIPNEADHWAAGKGEVTG
jgi:hypothetical protein